jgi:hypothetical protein
MWSSIFELKADSLSVCLSWYWFDHGWNEIFLKINIILGIYRFNGLSDGIVLSAISVEFFVNVDDNDRFMACRFTN